MIKVYNNHVLVRPDEKFRSSNGVEISSFADKMRHVSVYGEVIATPQHRFFHKKERDKLSIIQKRTKSHGKVLSKVQRLFPRSLEYYTKNTANIGDQVLFHYVSYMNAYSENGVVNIDGVDCILIPCHLLYAILGETITPLNGYIFVEPISITEEQRSRGGVSRHLTDSKMAGAGIIRYIGDDCKYLLYEDRNKGIDVKEGDVVYFRSIRGVSPEYKYHQRMNKDGMPLMRLQRKDILGFIKSN